MTIKRRLKHNFRTIVIDIFWRLWPQLPCYGRKASQFVDLLGYFTMKSSVDDDRIRVNNCVPIDIRQY